MTSRYEPTDEDMRYARSRADGFSSGRDHAAIMSAQLMASYLDGVDGVSDSVDEFRIRRARAFSQVWQEHTGPDEQRRRA